MPEYQRWAIPISVSGGELNCLTGDGVFWAYGQPYGQWRHRSATGQKLTLSPDVSL